MGRCCFFFFFVFFRHDWGAAVLSCKLMMAGRHCTPLQLLMLHSMLQHLARDEHVLAGNSARLEIINGLRVKAAQPIAMQACQ